MFSLKDSSTILGLKKKHKSYPPLKDYPLCYPQDSQSSTTVVRQNHNFYAFRFFACEFLNLVNVLFQIYFIDFFLDGEFTTYGSEVSFDPII